MRLVSAHSWISLTTAALIWAACSKKPATPAGSSDLPSASSSIKYIDTLANNVPLKHQGGLHSDADFTRIKARLTANAEPWVSAWHKLTANSHAQLNYSPNPATLLIRGGGTIEQSLPDNYSRAYNDVAAAYQCALRWKISGDASYAAKAVQILNAWAAICTGVSGDSNKYLAAGIYGSQFAIAGELLRDYSGWAAADFATYQRWMITVFYTLNHDFIVRHNGTCALHYWSNWDLCNLASIMAIGILSDKRVLYNEAMNYLQRGNGNGNLTNAINYTFTGANANLAQLQESGRDQGHATLVIAIIGNICQMAWNQGDDLFAFDNNLFLKGCEYIAKYNVANLDVPFNNYVYNDCGSLTTQTQVSSDSRSTVRPMWALPYYHYTRIKELTATYTAMGVQTTTPEGGGGDYGPNSGGFDQLGFGTLMYTRP